MKWSDMTTEEYNLNGCVTPEQYRLKQAKVGANSAFPWTGAQSIAPGITIRDYFAAAALTGIKANDAMCKRIMDIAIEKCVKQQDLIAQMAYNDADAMLKARQEGGMDQ